MAASTTNGPIIGINVTPFVDVVLVLLVIFMATSSYIVNPSIEVDLPEASSGRDLSQPPLAFALTADGNVFLDGERATWDEITRRCRRASASDAQARAIIAADGGARHRDVVKLIDVVKRSGVEHFALNVDPSALSQD